MRFHPLFSPYVLLAFLASPHAFAWGPEGHQTVGAMADRLLAGTHAATEVNTLLGGLTLQQVSVWADCAKGVDPSKNYAYTAAGKYPECKLFETPAGEAAMSDFVRRNDTNGQPKPGEEACHKPYHYTDVAIQHDRYQPGLIGTRDDDLVHAVLATTQVIRGHTAPAPFNVKDPQEALLLLTHYVGDLHQPLHVGAIYLPKKGTRVNPDTETFDPQTDTRGGNTLILKGTTRDLHTIWDTIPASLTASQVNAAWLQHAKGIPATAGPVLEWPTRWADDTLSGAQQAFRGLRFSSLQSDHWMATVSANYNTQKQRFCCVSGRSHGFGKLRVPMNPVPKNPHDRLQRPPLRKRHHSYQCAVVPGLPVELSESGGNAGGAWRRGRPFEYLPLGPEIRSKTGSRFPGRKKRPVGTSWRMDETYIKIRGQWKYLYRAVDRNGQTLDFLLTAPRDQKAARRFFQTAVRQHGLPAKVTIDQSGANTAALEALLEETEATIEIRQSKYLNNWVEQDHRAVKRLVRPRIGFKAVHSAKVTLQGIELMHMIKQGPMAVAGGQKRSAAGQFSSLTA